MALARVQFRNESGVVYKEASGERVRLYEAAPDLLAALQAFVANGTIDPDDRARARAAIAKATKE
jgi:hypothetical protein